MNKLQKIADRLNHSPVWNHTMLLVLLYFWEMAVLAVVEIIRYASVGYSQGLLKAWLLMTVPLLFIWVIFGVRNYYIHKKMGIWNYYRKKTRNGKLNI